MSNESSAYRVAGLTAGYDGRDVLAGVDLVVGTTGFTAVVGKNGCGKSTLLRAMGGRLTYRGSIRLSGKEVRDYAPKDLAKAVALLPQVRDVPHIPVRQLVEHGRFPYLGFPRILRPSDRRAVEDAMLAMRVESFADVDAARLSGGERQRVYLAMTLAQNAGVLLLDEPTTFLDMRDAWQLLAALKEISETRAVVAVLHDLDAALRIADRVLLLDGGRAAAYGTSQQVYDSGAVQRVYGVGSTVTQTPEGIHYWFYVE